MSSEGKSSARGPVLQYPIPSDNQSINETIVYGDPGETDGLLGDKDDNRQSCHISIRSRPHEMSSVSAFFSIVNSVVAGGILSIPFTFHLVGIGGGLIFLLSMGVAAWYTNNLLIWATEKQKATSYPDLGMKCMGWYGSSFVQLCIIFMNVGVLTGIWVTAADIIPHVFVIWFDYDPDLMSVRGACILACYLAVFPFLLFRSIHKMRGVSVLATFMVAGFALTVMGVFLESYFRDRISLKDVRYFKTEGTEKHWFRVLPIVCFSLTIHDVVPLVQDEIMEPKALHMSLVNLAAYGFTMLLYLIVGVFGYLTFQDMTRSDVVRNYGAGSYDIMDVVKMIYVLTILASYPLEHFSLRDSLDHFLFNRKEWTNFRFLAETVIVTLLTVVLAMVVPDLANVFAVTGTLTTFWLMFILPSLFYILSFKKFDFHKFVSYLMILIGFIVMLISVYIVFVDIYNGGFEHLEFWKGKEFN